MMIAVSGVRKQPIALVTYPGMFSCRLSRTGPGDIHTESRPPHSYTSTHTRRSCWSTHQRLKHNALSHKQIACMARDKMHS